jgi:hypothetical protein
MLSRQKKSARGIEVFVESAYVSRHSQTAPTKIPGGRFKVGWGEKR